MFVQQACNRCCRQRLLHKDELHLFFKNKCLHTCNGVNTREAKLRTKQKKIIQFQLCLNLVDFSFSRSNVYIHTKIFVDVDAFALLISYYLHD